MPDLPIVDSHLHLWDPSRFRMGWLDGLERLNRPHGLDDFDVATAGLDIEAMVYLQVEVDPAYALLEARWVEELARQDPRIRGIVAWAPLEHGELARAVVEALVRDTPHLKGIRRLIQDEPDPEFCAQPEFVRGVQALPDYGLSFDICVYHHQLPAAIELVRQCPEVSFVLDHIGKPDIRSGAFEPWAERISTLSGFPNMACKISGAVTEADHAAWTADDLAPYVRHAMDAFGEDRVMFGGDWPVATLASPYRRWVETLDALTADRSPEAKRKLWNANARRFYRLDG